MKTIYLMNKPQPDGSTCLSVATAAEWLAAVNGNKGLSAEQRRYFILDYIADGDDLDCMVIETPLAEYRKWDRGRPAEKRNRHVGQAFQQLSLDAPFYGSEDSGNLLDLIASDTQVESEACDIVLMEELQKALASWRPWANDLLEMYLNGQKRACTKIIARKYGVSPQVARKYKRQFEEFIKNFLGGVSF